mgnify:CR=1 FL=1
MKGIIASLFGEVPVYLEPWSQYTLFFVTENYFYKHDYELDSLSSMPTIVEELQKLLHKQKSVTNRKQAYSTVSS